MASAGLGECHCLPATPLPINYLCQPFNRGWNSISCTIYSKKKQNKQKKTISSLCQRCQICWLSAYLSFVTKSGPISSVIRRKKSFWTMSVCRCLHFVDTPSSSPHQILIRFMQMELSPLEKMQMEPFIVLWGAHLAAGDIFVLLTVKSASKNSCC